MSAKKNKFKKIFVIGHTEKIDRFYIDIGYDICIFDNYNENSVNKICDKMTEINSNKPDKKRKIILLILDDVDSDHNFHQSPSLKKYFFEEDI